MVASVTHATNGIGTESGDGAVSKTAWEEAHDVSGVALASHVHAGSDITSGTVADARIDSAIARDSEVSGAVSTHAGIATAHGTFANASHTHAAGDLPDLDSLTVPSADVSMNTHKITGLVDPGSNQDAATKKYVDDSVAAGVSFATPAVVLGTAAAAGAASSTIRSDSTIVAFDATAPAAVGTAAVGAAAVAARRDHVHATGAGTPSTQAFGDAAATGTGPAAAMTDHKHAMPAHASLPGHEFDYVQITSPVSITATTEGTANTVVTGSSVAYDGSTIVMIEFFAPNLIPPSAAAGYVAVLLYEDATLLGWLCLAGSPTAATQRSPGYGALRRTPSNASHVYTIKAIVSSGTGTVNAGAGGTGTALAAFIRITRV